MLPNLVRLAGLIAVAAALLAGLGAWPAPVQADPQGQADGLAEHDLIWLHDPDPGVSQNKEGNGNAIWGGGTFLKLIGKLATEGCNVNAIAIYDSEGGELLYSHHFQAPNFVNPDFGDGQYMRYVPTGTVLAFTCVDACDIFVGPGAEETRRRLDACLSVSEYIAKYNPERLPYSDIHCNYDFTTDVNDYFLHRVPIFQDTCIVYYDGDNYIYNGFSFDPIELDYDAPAFYRENIPFVFINRKFLSEGVDEAWSLRSMQRVILHELCHQQQHWYVSKFYDTYDKAEAQDALSALIRNRAMQELMRIVGHKEDGDGYLYLDETNKYYGTSSWNSSPTEFGAEACAHYVMHKMYDDLGVEYDDRVVNDFFIKHDEIVE